MLSLYFSWKLYPPHALQLRAGWSRSVSSSVSWPVGMCTWVWTRHWGVTPLVPYLWYIHFCNVVVNHHHSDLPWFPISFVLPWAYWLQVLLHLIKTGWVEKELGSRVAKHLKFMLWARSWADVFQQGCYSISAEDIASVFWLARK